MRSFNSEDTLAQVLGGLDLAEGDEILVVDSGSKDNTIAIAEQYGARVRRLQGPFNYSRSLNEGFQMAANPWVLVISSHCIPFESDLMARMRELVTMAAPDVVVGYGKVVLGRPKVLSDQILSGGMDEWNCGSLHHGGNTIALYRKAAWSEKHFDESLVTAEDVAWFLWAIGRGYRFARVEGAVVLYRNRGSLVHMFRKGWFESRLAAALLGERALSRGVLVGVRRLGLNFGHLCRLVYIRDIGLSDLARQMSHATGVFLGLILPLDQNLVSGSPAKP